MPETRVAWTPGAEPCLLRTVVDDLGGRSHLDTCQLTGQTDAAVTFTTRPTLRDQAKFLHSASRRGAGRLLAGPRRHRDGRAVRRKPLICRQIRRASACRDGLGAVLGGSRIITSAPYTLGF